MMSWIVSNLSTIILCAVLIAIVGLIVFFMVRNKRRGKSSCGCGCADCPMSGACHSKDKNA